MPRERVTRRQPILEQPEQLDQLLDEVVGCGLAAVALEREHRHRVGAGRAAQPEVDALGVEAAQRTERLGHLQRAVVRQHHAAAADPHAARARGDRADQHLGRRAGERRRRVVLGDPVAVVAERVGQLREVERAVERLRGRRPLRDRGLVEDAQAHG